MLQLQTAMILAGQNATWGKNLKQATQFWKRLNISHIMVKWSQELPFLNNSGKANENTFKKLGNYQKQFGVKYHIHPYDLSLRSIYLTPSFPKAKPILKQLLQQFDKLIYRYNLYPIIILHCPRMGKDSIGFKITHKQALKKTGNFYQNLNLKSQLVLETMHDPYRNPGHALLGYKPEHFKQLIGNENIGVCIDTGHLNMSKAGIKPFLNLPYNIHSLHINGNYKDKDSHLIPTSKTLDEYNLLHTLLNKCKGPAVFEIKRQPTYTKQKIKKLSQLLKKLRTATNKQ